MVPNFVLKYLAFVKADKGQKLQRIKYKKETEKRVKIGKGQNYTPPSEGLFAKVLNILEDAKNDSKEIRISVLVSVSSLAVVMFLISKLFWCQNIV